MGVPMFVLVGPALEAARRALRYLDGDQIPSDLRRVAGHSGRLTPPLARSLLRALDRYEWLRERAAEAWPEADTGRDEAEGAAALFLLRPEGWELRLAAIAEREGARAASASGADDAGEREALAAERDRLRARLKEERKKAAERERAVASELEEERKRRRTAAALEARELGGRREEADRLMARITELEARVMESEAALRRSRDELRDERRARAAAESEAAAAAARPSWIGDDPLDLAVGLDQAAVMARPPATGSAAAARVDGAPAEASPALPAGIGPDTGEALAWLIRESGPTTVLVDGYNAGFALVGAGSPRPARERLAPVLEQLSRLGAGRLRVIVVYDSRVDPEPRRITTGPVEVRFTSAEVTADEEIAALALEIEGRLVVVSSDREVRDAAEQAGALALWSQALVSWANRR